MGCNFDLSGATLFVIQISKFLNESKSSSLKKGGLRSVTQSRSKLVNCQVNEGLFDLGDNCKNRLNK